MSHDINQEPRLNFPSSGRASFLFSVLDHEVQIAIQTLLKQCGGVDVVFCLGLIFSDLCLITAAPYHSFICSDHIFSGENTIKAGHWMTHEIETAHLNV